MRGGDESTHDKRRQDACTQLLVEHVSVVVDRDKAQSCKHEDHGAVGGAAEAVLGLPHEGDLDVGDGGHCVPGSQDHDPGLVQLVHDVKDPGAVLPEQVVA